LLALGGSAAVSLTETDCRFALDSDARRLESQPPLRAALFANKKESVTRASQAARYGCLL